MERAVTFSLTFTTDELARKFVQRATHAFGVACLRYGKVVYVVTRNVDEMRDVLSIGRELGGEGGA